MSARTHTTLVTEHSTDEIIRSCREAITVYCGTFGHAGWFDAIVVDRDVEKGLKKELRERNKSFGRRLLSPLLVETDDIRLHGLPVIPFDTQEERVAILMDLHSQGKRALMVEREPEIKLKED